MQIPNPGITVGIRRKRFIELLNEKNLVLADPARDRIASALSGMTEGFVGSDLESICREAGMLALREDATLVTQRHFEAAQKKVHPMMNERLQGVLPEDPAALQRRAPQTGAAAGIPVILI